MKSRTGGKPLSRSSTYARWGGVVGRGAVVKMSGGVKGVVLRLLPWNNFSRAYGRQALVATYGKHGRVHTREVGIGDMRVIGYAKRIPKTERVTIPPSAEAVAHHERIRDIRRAGQGAGYDPVAPYNVPYERPLPGDVEVRVARRRRSRRGGR